MKNKLAIVYGGKPQDADVVKSLLESEGITAFLENEAMGTWAPWYVAAGSVNPVKVLVPQNDFDKSKQLIQKFLDRKTENKQDK